MYAPPEGSRLPWEDCLIWDGRPLPRDGLPDMVREKFYLVLSSEMNEVKSVVDFGCLLLFISC